MNSFGYYFLYVDLFLFMAFFPKHRIMLPFHHLLDNDTDSVYAVISKPNTEDASEIVLSLDMSAEAALALALVGSTYKMSPERK